MRASTSELYSSVAGQVIRHGKGQDTRKTRAGDGAGHGKDWTQASARGMTGPGRVQGRERQGRRQGAGKGTGLEAKT